MSKPIDPKTLGGIFHKVWADYDATRQSRFIRKRTGVAPQGGSEDYNFRQEIDYYDLIEQARDMDRNDGLVGTLADRRVDNIVQQGFTLDTKTGDKKLDLDLWQRWQAFSNDPEACDIAGELCWHEMERLVCRAESIDGDIVVVGTEEGSFQTIEAHAIQTSTRIENTFLGVTRDIYGRREQYHVRYDLNEFGQKSESTPIDVRDENNVRQLFHIYDPKRVSGTRGVTQLAPVFALSGMLEDINFAKLVQQQIVSCFAILRSRAPGAGSSLPSTTSPYGEPSTENTRTGSRVLEGISPGMEIEAEEGETLSGFSPNVPNSEYFQQVRLIMQIVGVNFGLPLCLVLMDGSETNFSGWRGAVDEARKGFVADQMNLVRRLHTPAYVWWLHREMAMDSALRKAATRTGISIFGHQWQLPTWSYIEPVADAEGDTAQLRNALTSPRRMHAARGKDWETIAEEIIDDNVYAISAAQAKANEVNKKFPDAPPLSWRDLIPLPMPEGQTLAMQDPNAIKAQEEEQEEPAVKPTAHAKKKEPVALSESEQETRLLAEIMLHVFGDDAEQLLYDGEPLAFDESKVNRDSRGRFVSKGSPEAFSAAKQTLKRALSRPKTKKSANALAEKLSNLTVKQLTELKKEYGIKASGRTKQQLVDKLADRLDRGRRQAEQKKKTVKKKVPVKKKAVKKKAADKKKEAEKRAAERREAEKPKLTATQMSSGEFRDFLKSPNQTFWEREQAVIGWIKSSDEKDVVKIHGMSKADVTRDVQIDGLKWKVAEGTEDVAAQSIINMYGRGDIHPRLFEAVDSVVFTAQRNKDDDYWAAKYGYSGFQSAATGGDGSTTVYGNKPLGVGTFAHESGHGIAKKTWGSTTPAAGSEYAIAQAEEPPVSSYGASSPSEDFAEAIKMYTNEPIRLKEQFPLKFAAVEKLLNTEQ